MHNLSSGEPYGREEEPERLSYPALALGVGLVAATLLGNSLVCLCVTTERSLRTATNWFIVSLAVADLLVGILVLPLFVYSEFLSGVWTLGSGLCDALMTLDVMLCTASIYNLCAISLDRFIAVRAPLHYEHKRVNVRQAALITATWLLSLALASPLALGANSNPERDPAVCRLERPAFVIFSSVCSFFVPCPAMLALYCCVCRGLRRWSARHKCSSSSVRRSQEKESVRTRELSGAGAVRPSGSPTCQGESSIPGEKEQQQHQQQHHHQDEKKKEEHTSAFTNPTSSTMKSAHRYLQGSCGRRGTTEEVSGMRPSWFIGRRDRKAMKVLPIVIGAFLVCWTPFFVVHVSHAVCPGCRIPALASGPCTWLGYVNSALNPLIYAAFNPDFRRALRRRCPCQSAPPRRRRC
ncbi:D(4) dopamine receptor-like [Petromyzon marinus]|nr:D(4) dopamine receptor-like isoform X2 [Petromyzon marinus]